MVFGYWALLGAFLGAVCGAMFGAVTVLLFYHYPYDPHCDLYPLSITIGNMGMGDGILGVVPGGIVGSVVGAAARSAQGRRHRRSLQENTSSSEIWPPPPTPSTS